VEQAIARRHKLRFYSRQQDFSFAETSKNNRVYQRLLSVITFDIQIKSGFLWAPRGFEVGLMMMLMFIAICFGGGGRYSVDRVIGREF
jgi:hypothetical protein